jgi:hypothetical protein
VGIVLDSVSENKQLVEKLKRTIRWNRSFGGFLVQSRYTAQQGEVCH